MSENAMINPREACSILAVIERAATNPEVDIDKMQRLLDMHERILAKQAEAQFAAALADLQSELPSIAERGSIKDRSGRVQSTYALWEDVNEAIKPVLKRHGFALLFHTETNDKISVTGILSHRAGHRESTSITLPADASGSKNAVQAVASSVSYGKRYTAGALLNLTSHGEDDDAQSAVATAKIPRITDEQVLALESLLTDTGSDKANFLRYMQAERLEDIQATEYENAVATIKRAAENRKKLADKKAAEARAKQGQPA